MSTSTPPKITDKVIVAADKLDQIVMEVGGALSLRAKSFSESLAVAAAIGDMRALLTDDVMRPIMNLMNTPIGFLTDRDPSKPVKNGPPATAYGIPVVRECFIESRLRGFHPVGNEWNIIAAKCYGAKAGYKRLVRTFDGISTFRDTYEIPRRVGQDRAQIKCRGAWMLHGTKDEIEREYSIKADSYASDDSIVGKATRKLNAEIYSILSGTSAPEGEADEATDIESTTAPADTATAAPTFKGPGSKEADPSTPAPGSIQERLENFVVSTGFTFDHFIRWARSQNMLEADSAPTCFAEVKAAFAELCLRSPAGLSQGLKAVKGGDK